MASLAAVFAAVFVVLNLMLSWLIIQPVSRMSAAADKVSTGDFDQPEFPEGAATKWPCWPAPSTACAAVSKRPCR
jgi:nitrate/nitrite-specific signal transduction histidine kinase